MSNQIGDLIYSSGSVCVHGPLLHAQCSVVQYVCGVRPI